MVFTGIFLILLIFISLILLCSSINIFKLYKKLLHNLKTKEDYQQILYRKFQEDIRIIDDKLNSTHRILTSIKDITELDSALISHKETIEELRNSFDEITDELNKEKSVNRFLKEQLTQKGVIFL